MDQAWSRRRIVSPYFSSENLTSIAATDKISCATYLTILSYFQWKARTRARKESNDTLTSGTQMKRNSTRPRKAGTSCTPDTASLRRPTISSGKNKSTYRKCAPRVTCRRKPLWRGARAGQPRFAGKTLCRTLIMSGDRNRSAVRRTKIKTFRTSLMHSDPKTEGT